MNFYSSKLRLAYEQEIRAWYVDTGWVHKLHMYPLAQYDNGED
jgi:hypothetical protein